MLILPEGRYAPKILLPQPQGYWNPSLSVPRDQLGNPIVEQYWRITARLDDGHIVWRGRFDDRDEADAFFFALFTGSLQYEPALWRLPTPWWHPDLGETLTYDFTSPRFLSGASGANQTDTVPADWNSSSNSIEVISHAGLSDGAETNFIGGGGGGGGYAKSTNVPLTPGGTATYHLDSPGAGTGTAAATFYNGATLAASSVGICGGGDAAGVGGAGASVTNAIGSAFHGGNGGSGLVAPCCGPQAGGGGGGAAGPHGIGGDGVTPNSSTEGAGGTGDNGNTAAGANGTQFDATHGSGGGGVGGAGDTSGIPGNGGNYGGGGGGGGNPPGTSIAGLIAQAYTPVVAVDRAPVKSLRIHIPRTGMRIRLRGPIVNDPRPVTIVIAPNQDWSVGSKTSIPLSASGGEISWPHAVIQTFNPQDWSQKTRVDLPPKTSSGEVREDQPIQTFNPQAWTARAQVILPPASSGGILAPTPQAWPFIARSWETKSSTILGLQSKGLLDDPLPQRIPTFNPQSWAAVSHTLQKLRTFADTRIPPYPTQTFVPQNWSPVITKTVLAMLSSGGEMPWPHAIIQLVKATLNLTEDNDALLAIAVISNPAFQELGPARIIEEVRKITLHAEGRYYTGR